MTYSSSGPAMAAAKAAKSHERERRHDGRCTPAGPGLAVAGCGGLRLPSDAHHSEQAAVGVGGLGSIDLAAQHT